MPTERVNHPLNSQKSPRDNYRKRRQKLDAVNKDGFDVSEAHKNSHLVNKTYLEGRLTQYIADRTYERDLFSCVGLLTFGVPYLFKLCFQNYKLSSTKISAANKLLSKIKGNSDVTMTSQELSALKDGRLREINHFYTNHQNREAILTNTNSTPTNTPGIRKELGEPSIGDRIKKKIRNSSQRVAFSDSVESFEYFIKSKPNQLISSSSQIVPEKEIKEYLVGHLEQYIQDRKLERAFFIVTACLTFGLSYVTTAWSGFKNYSDKVRAAEKSIEFLNGDTSIVLNESEQQALSEGRLGKITSNSDMKALFNSFTDPGHGQKRTLS